MEDIQDQDNIIISHILLICKHYAYLSKNSEILNFTGLKNYILEKKIRRTVAQNNLYKKLTLKIYC